MKKLVVSLFLIGQIFTSNIPSAQAAIGTASGQFIVYLGGMGVLFMYGNDSTKSIPLTALILGFLIVDGKSDTQISYQELSPELAKSLGIDNQTRSLFNLELPRLNALSQENMSLIKAALDSGASQEEVLGMAKTYWSDAVTTKNISTSTVATAQLLLSHGAKL